MMSSSSNPCFGSHPTVALGKNKPVINRPGMSPGQTPLIPPSERSMLNRLDQHLERGKEGARFGSSLDKTIRKPTVDYQMVLHTGYCFEIFWIFANENLQWSWSFSCKDWEHGQGSSKLYVFLQFPRFESIHFSAPPHSRFRQLWWISCPFFGFPNCHLEQVGVTSACKLFVCNSLWFLWGDSLSRRRPVLLCPCSVEGQWKTFGDFKT